MLFFNVDTCDRLSTNSLLSFTLFLILLPTPSKSNNNNNDFKRLFVLLQKEKCTKSSDRSNDDRSHTLERTQQPIVLACSLNPMKKATRYYIIIDWLAIWLWREDQPGIFSDITLRGRWWEKYSQWTHIQARVPANAYKSTYTQAYTWNKTRSGAFASAKYVYSRNRYMNA